MERVIVTGLAFIGGAIGGWLVAFVGYILYFEISGAIDRDGGTAMAVAFALGPMLGVVTGVVAAVFAAKATRRKR